MGKSLPQPGCRELDVNGKGEGDILGVAWLFFGWSVLYKNIAGMLAQEDKQEKWEGLFPLQSVSLAVLVRVCYIAYFCVHSRASLLYFSRSALYVWAISGTRGSSGLGSQRSEQIESRTLETVRAGDHWLRRMSKQMLPLLFMLG